MSADRPNFLIAAPPYNRIFAGVQVLHDLCHELNLLGYKAGIIFFHGGDGQETPYQWAISNRPDLYVDGHLRHQLPAENPQKALAEFLENGILIYPEIIKGNPLAAKRVVRYVLNKDDSEFPGEFVCAFSKLFRKDPDHVLFKMTVPKWMNEDNTYPWHARKMDATYFGKGPKYVECKRIPDTLLIERDWPRDQEQLAIILKQSRFLFSYDGVSGIHNDAIMCGCVPVILHDKQIPRGVLDTGELRYPKISLSDLNNRESVVYDRNQLENEAKELKNTIKYYESSWHTRVYEFTLACRKRFGI